MRFRKMTNDARTTETAGTKSFRGLLLASGILAVGALIAAGGFFAVRERTSDDPGADTAFSVTSGGETDRDRDDQLLDPTEPGNPTQVLTTSLQPAQLPDGNLGGSPQPGEGALEQLSHDDGYAFGALSCSYPGHYKLELPVFGSVTRRIFAVRIDGGEWLWSPWYQVFPPGSVDLFPGFISGGGGHFEEWTSEGWSRFRPLSEAWWFNNVGAGHTVEAFEWAEADGSGEWHNLGSCTTYRQGGFFFR